MPAKYRVKKYEPGVYYIYNRGLDGRNIFENETDYKMFKGSFERYLGKLSEGEEKRFMGLKPSLVEKRQKMYLGEEVKVIAYCLLPGSFHFLIKQSSVDGITKLMRRVMTNYVMYFNNKRSRQGTLFENVYRGIRVAEEEVVKVAQLIHLLPRRPVVRRFGPVGTVTVGSSENHIQSSYSGYLGLNTDNWITYDLYKEWANELKRLPEVGVAKLMKDKYPGVGWVFE